MFLPPLLVSSYFWHWLTQTSPVVLESITASVYTSICLPAWQCFICPLLFFFLFLTPTQCSAKQIVFSSADSPSCRCRYLMSWWRKKKAAVMLFKVWLGKGEREKKERENLDKLLIFPLFLLWAEFSLPLVFLPLRMLTMVKVFFSFSHRWTTIHQSIYLVMDVSLGGVT